VGFAFIDVETTGFVPEKFDRIVEIAVVVTDENLNPTQTFESLVNPQRDVGPTKIHQITATQVLAAPTFSEIANHIASLLNDQVVVAHNLPFDKGFVGHSLSAAGVHHDFGNGVCSLSLARRQPNWPLKLDELVDYLGIKRKGASHSAMSDALACLEVAKRASGFEGIPFRSSTSGLASAPPRSLKREIATWAISAHSYFLSIPDTGSEHANSYLDLLSTCLADGRIDKDERTALDDLIRHCQFSSQRLNELHHRYLHNVIERATADGVIDEFEWDQIHTASHLLGVQPEVPEVMAQTSLVAHTSRCTTTIVPGMAICLSGDHQVPRDELAAAAEAAGLVVMGAMSKKVDLLVCADEASQSRKAKMARSYKVPITNHATLDEFLRLHL